MTQWQGLIALIKRAGGRIIDDLCLIIGRFRQRTCVRKPVDSRQVDCMLQAWLQTAAGKQLELQQLIWLETGLNRFFGYYAVQYGVSRQRDLLQSCVIKHHVRLSHLIDHKVRQNIIYTDAAWWPIVPNSLDLVLLQHILETVENPQQTLREAACSVRAGGRLVIIGLIRIVLCKYYGCGALIHCIICGAYPLRDSKIG